MSSSSKRTKHIRVRYSFIKYRIAVGGILVKQCPTGVMVADHFTKPLQRGTVQEVQSANSRNPHLND